MGEDRDSMLPVLLLLAATCAPLVHAAGQPNFERARFEVVHNNTSLQATDVQVRYAAGPKGAKMELRVTGRVRKWLACENAHCRGEVGTMVYDSGKRAGWNNTRYGIHHHTKNQQRALFLQPADGDTFETFELRIVVAAEQKDLKAAEELQKKKDENKRNGIDDDEDEDEEPELHHEASELDLAIRVYYSLHNPYLQAKEQAKEL